MNKNPKIALVHDWLTGMRGGEKVLEIFCDLFPDAPIYTLLHIKGKVSKKIESHKIITSFIQKLPCAKKKYRSYLPLMPLAIESFDMSNYDLVLSSSHCVAKGVKVKKNALHISYCHTPMRYIWDQYDEYFSSKQAHFIVRACMKILRPYLQKWDQNSSQNVNYFIANSNFVKDRIKKYYFKEAHIIHPPVDTQFFMPESNSPEPSSFYLIVSALAPYKKVDLAIQVFNILKQNLKIIGSGPSEKKLKKMAHKNIEFLGWKSNEELRWYYQHCKALIFPGTEDFGIVPLEAMACGTPVIAYAKGGALETIQENKTGIFFKEKTPESLLQAIEKFNHCFWEKNSLRENALLFNTETTKENLKNFILKCQK
ncbi:MAG: glycosyltransferase [Elusimicrobia bacterium]|nr:glycosyltransferase [Elusimicrobiota bacterium]